MTSISTPSTIALCHVAPSRTMTLIIGEFPTSLILSICDLVYTLITNAITGLVSRKVNSPLASPNLTIDFLYWPVLLSILEEFTK